MLPLEIREVVWNFWHNEEFLTESTLTSRPAKLRTQKPKIQNDLQYKSSTTTTFTRNHEYYEGQWLIFQMTYKELYVTYLERNPDQYISYGTFIALKPFYVRTATTKDVEMCVCKQHLHMRWALKSLIEVCKENEIDLGDTKNYDTFFSHLTVGCKSNPNSYITWECTPNYKTICPSISNKWDFLKEIILSKNPQKTVEFTQFVKKPHVTKKGKHIVRLESDTSNVKADYILEFVNVRLPSFIHTEIN